VGSGERWSWLRPPFFEESSCCHPNNDKTVDVSIIIGNAAEGVAHPADSPVSTVVGTGTSSGSRAKPVPDDDDDPSSPSEVSVPSLSSSWMRCPAIPCMAIDSDQEIKIRRHSQANTETASVEKPGLDNLPMCPMVGCSFAFLQAFAEEGSRNSAVRRLQARTFQAGELPGKTDPTAGTGPTAQYEGAGGGEDFTMGSVCARLIKPVTKSTKSQRMSRHIHKSSTQLFLPDSPTNASHTDQVGLQNMNELADQAEEEEQLSYAELAMRADLKDSLGNPAFGQATHFVSHAWRYEFTSFVEAIGNWVEKSRAPQESTYFWVDAFVVNQHTSQEYPQEWWSTRFMQAVGEIGNTILVLEPWHDPVPFTRAWVIWELYCTSVTGARLHLTMRKSEMESFNDTLVNSFEKVQTILSSLDVSKSEAYHLVDQEMIHNEVRRTIGFTKLNELVQTRLMQWLTETAQTKLSEMNSMLTSGVSQDIDRLRAESFSLHGNIARMLRESGNLGEAEAAFRNLIQVLELNAADKSAALPSMNQLAVTLQKAGKNEEALKIHRDCLNRRTKLLGALHADSLQSASNLAVLLGQMGPSPERFKEARTLFERAISGREQTVGADHVSTLYTVSSLARLLSQAPGSLASDQLFATAESLHERAVLGLIKQLHEAHPLTLSAMHSQASNWLAHLEFHMSKQISPTESDEIHEQVVLKKVMEQYRKVADLRTEKLGRQHPDTVATELALRECTRRLRSRRIQSKGTAYSSWTELCHEEMEQLNTRDNFTHARMRLRQYGVEKLLDELTGQNIVDAQTKMLSTGMTPFNIFARLAAGVFSQPNMAEEQPKLGRFRDKFMVVCNRPECDEQWESSDPMWCGKASMSKNHRMLILKDLHWEWFNALTFGYVSGLKAGIALLKDAREAAHLWVSAGGEAWPPLDRVGLFVQVYSHCSINAFHLHIVDLDNLGPTFEKMVYKNLRLEDAISVLEEEEKQGTVISTAS